MSVDIRSSDRRRYINELQAREKEIAAGLLKVSQPASPKAVQENEKRLRREIANSNERRRMQCINAGFSSLRALIPQLEGEKLSKAAILQHTTEYITSVEKEKARLQMQLDQHKKLLMELGQDRVVADTYVSSSPPPTKRKKRDTESSDEGVGSLSDASDEGGSELRHENMSLRHQLEAARNQCIELEERNRLLEAQLLSLLQVKPPHASSLTELRSVSMESHHPHEPHYNREVVEVIGSREALVPSPRAASSFQPPRPLSPTPERGMAMETSTPLDISGHRSAVLVESSSRYSYPRKRDTMSPAVNMEVTASRDTNTPGVIPPRVSSAGLAMSTEPASPATSTDQTSYHHHHNYCHRDHPRRRHRQQAQLEQQREEELRRQRQEEVSLASSTASYRPKHNTQNLENLVEAIRQIEGDRVLCDDRKFYEEEHRLFDNRQCVTNLEESERESSSISDQEELKSEISGRDSPLPHHHNRHLHLQPQEQEVDTQNVVISYQLTSYTSPVSIPSSSICNTSSSSFSEKYPIATHLLHRPLLNSYCRPEVIVRKV